jgi:GT2 family glycosyltransferase
MILSNVGVVAIGRNEGERLRRCLESVKGKTAGVVYVDSGSSDQSVTIARQAGAEVVALDMSRPFTAARARNEGFERLMAECPGVELVQFVDGDCEVVNGWLEMARDYLVTHRDVAVVCGRRRERNPGSSIYNRLCDIEWDTPVGETTECGGDAMMRVGAFEAAGQFDPSVIAGEEPELCQRMRQQGWRVMRIDAEMTLHDAGMTRFGQWWKRCLRAGHAHAQAAAMHGGSLHYRWGRSVWSAWLWGLVLPLMVLALAVPTRGASAVLLLIYLPLLVRIAMRAGQRRLAMRDRWLYAGACVVGKFPEVMGQGKYWMSRLSRKPSAIIEYKHAPTA